MAMRRAAEAYLHAGGQWARFAGNFMWQVRLEQQQETVTTTDSSTSGKHNHMRQVCFKYDFSADPVYGTNRQHELTFVWDSPMVGWPGASTFGLNASQGLYVRLANCTPRNSGGFTVYRPEHPIFAGTDLMYGDVLGVKPLFLGTKLTV